MATCNKLVKTERSTVPNYRVSVSTASLNLEAGKGIRCTKCAPAKNIGMNRNHDAPLQRDFLCLAPCCVSLTAFFARFDAGHGVVLNVLRRDRAYERILGVNAHKRPVVACVLRAARVGADEAVLLSVLPV